MQTARNPPLICLVVSRHYQTPGLPRPGNYASRELNINKEYELARKKETLKDPPEGVELQKRYFGTKDFSPNNVSYEVLALIYLLRWVISPIGDKSGNPYTKEPVKFALKVVANAVGKPHEGYDYLEALDGLEDL